MKNKFKVGTMDYLGNGREENLVTVEFELKDGIFSMSGYIWNRTKTDVYSAGQNLEEILKAFPHNRKLKRMIEVWREYHLNDMQPACEHQRALGWGKNKVNGQWEGHLYEKEGGCLMKSCPECGYAYGSKWQKLEIPGSIVNEIESWTIKKEGK